MIPPLLTEHRQLEVKRIVTKMKCLNDTKGDKMDTAKEVETPLKGKNKKAKASQKKAGVQETANDATDKTSAGKVRVWSCTSVHQ